MTAKFDETKNVQKKHKMNYFECELAKGTKESFVSSFVEGIGVCVKSHFVAPEIDKVEDVIKKVIEGLEYDFVIAVHPISQSEARDKYYIEEAFLVD